MASAEGGVGGPSEAAAMGDSGADTDAIDWSIDHVDLLVGIAEVDGLTVAPSQGELAAWFDDVVQRVPDPPEATRQAIRQLLKKGGFKATGRNKPASEYLAEARRGGAFPRIFDVVDVNNALSLETGWPISVLDRDRCRALSPVGRLEIRFGREGERYVFNPAGHAIDLAGLLGIAAVDGPMLGNPVKDAMHAKVEPGTTRVIAALWTSRACASVDRVREVTERFAARLGGGRVRVLGD